MTTLKSILKRLNNKGTIVSLAALIVSLLCQFGLNIDSEKILTIVQTICSILIILGLLNFKIYSLIIAEIINIIYVTTLNYITLKKAL